MDYTSNLNLYKWNEKDKKKDTVAEMAKNMDVIDAQLAQIAINVKSLGAKGDGVSDDTQPFQDAFNYANSLGGVKVYVPKGNYKITSMLKIFSNTKLELDTNAVLVNYILTGATSLLSNYYTTDDVFGYDGESNITITGGTILCIPDSTYVDIFKAKGDWGNQAMSFAHGKNIVIDGVTVQDVYRTHAIEIAGCMDVEVKNCIFDGWLHDPIYDTTPHREAVQIENCVAGSSMAKNQDGTESINIKIHNNICKVINSDYTSFGSGFGAHLNSGNMSNILIYDNVIEGCLYAGIEAGLFVGGRITGNKITNCKYGIYSIVSKPLFDMLIADNIIQSIEEMGLRLFGGSSNVTIRNNRISETGHVGLYVDQNSDNIKIYDNDLLNCNNALKDDTFARIYGLKNSFIFNNVFDKTNAVAINIGVRFTETAEYPHVNTKQWNNRVLFACTSYDLVTTGSIIDNTDVFYSGSHAIYNNNAIASTNNPLKYRSLILTVSFNGTKKTTIPVSLQGNEVSVIHLGATNNSLSVLKFTVVLANGNFKVANPRLTTITDGVETTIDVVQSTGYTITKIEGIY